MKARVLVVSAMSAVMVRWGDLRKVRAVPLQKSRPSPRYADEDPRARRSLSSVAEWCAYPPSFCWV